MRTHIRTGWIVTLGLAAILSSRSANAQPPAADPAKPEPFKVETVVEGLEVPWAITWDHTGRMLFTERPGRVRVMNGKKLDPKPIYQVTDLKTGSGEIGLMGICLHPDFKTNGYIYIAYGGKTDKDVRVVRLKEADGKVTEDKVIVKGVPASMNHAGCAIKFGPDGKLYITTGEAFTRALAQDKKSLGGKTLRVNDDGSVPDDNPFVAEKDARPEIWSYGHRNAQGIDWDDGGIMFQSEHGPTGEVGVGGHDELNIVEKGHNLGWPAIWGDKTKPGMDAPVHFWKDAIAPGSLVIYKADKFPEWRGSVLIGGLGGLRSDPTPGIFRIEMNGRNFVKEERLATTFGRIRCVAVGPDGLVYFTTSNRDGRGRSKKGDDRILRLAPTALAKDNAPAVPAGGEEEKPAVAALAPLGSKDNPVKCDMPNGEREYLNRLRCPDGSAPSFRRRGSTGKGPHGNILDVYEVSCGGNMTEIYMDMYFPGHKETESVPGFTIAK